MGAYIENYHKDASWWFFAQLVLGQCHSQDPERFPSLSEDFVKFLVAEGPPSQRNKLKLSFTFIPEKEIMQ